MYIYGVGFPISVMTRRMMNYNTSDTNFERFLRGILARGSLQCKLLNQIQPDGNVHLDTVEQPE